MLPAAVPTQAGDDEEKIVHTGKNVKSPSGVKYFTKNNLTVDMININSDGSVRTIDYPAGYEYSQMSDDEKRNGMLKKCFSRVTICRFQGLRIRMLRKLSTKS